MSIFRIQPHGRLQEWVAEEKGYFKEEGLEYEFKTSYFGTAQPTVASADQAPDEVKRGAFETMEAEDVGPALRRGLEQVRNGTPALIAAKIPTAVQEMGL